MFRRVTCSVWILTLVMGSSRVRADSWDPPAVRDNPNHFDFVERPNRSNELIDIGRRLFLAKFNELDGAGRPGATGDSKPTTRAISTALGLTRIAGPDAMACSSCHNDPAIGGSGDFVANVFVGAHFSDPPTQTIRAGETSERNTIGLFGAGLIEIAAREMTGDLRRQRERAREFAEQTGRDVEVLLKSKGMDFGSIVVHPNGTFDANKLQGIDYDLIVRPFGVKGVAASLREFSIAALNQHHGIQASERFGWDRTGFRDFDLDGVESEFSIGQLTALVAFQASLAAPKQVFSSNLELREREERGQALFEDIGCAVCHVQRIEIASSEFLEPNPYNRPGAISPDDVGGVVRIPVLHSDSDVHFVEAYSDLKRHNLCDDDVNHFCNELVKQDNVDTELFLTAKLWDAATSAPYGHRGDLRTLSKAILAHGGEARGQREAFLLLDDAKKQMLVEFLLTLGRVIKD